MPRKNDPLEAIKDDIETRYRKVLNEFAAEMNFQVQLAYDTVISRFYNEYTPKVYERTESTRKASDKWDNIFGYTPVGDDFEYGIKVGAENIPDIDGHQPYRADTDWVFNRTFEEGIHGYFKVEAQDWANKRLQEAIFDGKKLSAKEMRRLEKLINSAPPFYRSPREGMDKLFNKITGQRYMDKIYKEIFDKEFG